MKRKKKKKKKKKRVKKTNAAQNSAFSFERAFPQTYRYRRKKVIYQKWNGKAFKGQTVVGEFRSERERRR